MKDTFGMRGHQRDGVGAGHAQVAALFDRDQDLAGVGVSLMALTPAPSTDSAWG
jgi:hypothetical protein